MSNTTEQVKALLLDIRQDTLHYDSLVSLLQQQREAMITCDVDKMGKLNEELLTIYQRLHDSSRRRSTTLKNLNLPENGVGISRIVPKLPSPLAEHAQSWWETLEAQASFCQQLNERNGLLLTSQRQTLDTLSGNGSVEDFLYKG